MAIYPPPFRVMRCFRRMCVPVCQTTNAPLLHQPPSVSSIGTVAWRTAKCLHSLVSALTPWLRVIRRVVCELVCGANSTGAVSTLSTYSVHQSHSQTYTKTPGTHNAGVLWVASYIGNEIAQCSGGGNCRVQCGCRSCRGAPLQASSSASRRGIFERPPDDFKRQTTNRQINICTQRV